MTKKILLSLVCVLILYTAYSYIKVEYLTKKYGNEFINEYSQNNMTDSIDYLKVLKYNGDNAKVLYVGGSADYYWFKKENGKWIMEKWHTVWSKSGSADKFTWPPYF